ncbi:uncharacterized protein METZ01_LOCUS167778 [marine metagenome]|uniref:Uncharacterized protein n=1 Tax=marine metagenome TaxID=408172 RepID=A0A382BMM2_9ZZZZ
MLYLEYFAYQTQWPQHQRNCHQGLTVWRRPDGNRFSMSYLSVTMLICASLEMPNMGGYFFK